MELKSPPSHRAPCFSQTNIEGINVHFTMISARSRRSGGGKSRVSTLYIFLWGSPTPLYIYAVQALYPPPQEGNKDNIFIFFQFNGEKIFFFLYIISYTNTTHFRYHDLLRLRITRSITSRRLTTEKALTPLGRPRPAGMDKIRRLSNRILAFRLR